MDIGEVAKKSGIAPSALRYYEAVGLIQSTGRKGLRRQYAASVLETLALITLAKEADFRLNELTHLFKSHKSRPSIDRTQLRRKASEITRKIKKLEAARDGWVHASQCPAPSHLECPKFLRLMSIATKKHKLRSRR